MAQVFRMRTTGGPPGRPELCYIARLACGSISYMTELTDASGAFSYGDSILVGERGAAARCA